ncbi:MAG: outer membrane protein assembly factor BamA [Deltaproteobacteria bacterium]|nr:MAG: outer membrane protein assembly factor BamA [Deltaproteobacteria bacterium]TMB23402.1 MAG: outer membrane protein assembly factor BamA [Deltaproteobacteria bacterium]
MAKVNVQGNRRVETDAIRAALPLKVGDTYDKEKLKSALLAVWRMGYFNDVKLDVSLAKAPLAGYVLTVLVSEKPAVREVKLEGNEEVSKDDFKETIEVKPFQILDQEAVRKSAKKMQEKYVEKGFFLAEVTPKIVPLPNNEVNVLFQINEHAKITVKEIRFVGNRALSDSELKDAMLTQEGGPFSFLTGAGTYREEAFQRDEIVLQGLYFDQGYIYVKFGKPAIELSPDKRYIFITMTIDEGEPFDVGKIDVAGDLLVPREQLLALVTTRSGERFSKTRLQNDMNRLLDVYKDKGYAYANVTPDTAVDSEKRLVDLTYVFQKGQPVTIEKIEIVGNNKTRDKVIRREMRIAEGDLYSGTGVRASKARVTALGFFDSVEINQKRGTTDDKMLLEVSVKEKLTGTFQIGFGFAGGENFFGQAQLAQNNLLGYGHTASLSLQISSIRQLFQLSYLDPYVFDTQWTGSIDLYRSELLFSGFDRSANGGSLTAGYDFTNIAPWLEDFRLFLTYTLEQVTVSAAVGTQDVLANQFSSGRTSSVRISFNYDKRDNRLFPTNGHLESASAEFASSLFGSQNLFQRFRLIERFYRPMWLGMVFKTNVSLGYIRATDPIDHPIAISEKFFEGGINSIRGYSLRSISPTLRIATSREPNAGIIDFPVGGNKELITNWEIEFPIFGGAGLRGVVFYDAGNVFSETENFFQSSQRNGTLPLGLFHSVGFGIRWFSPLGPLRFETGFPLTRRPIDDTYLFEFTIGNFF